MPTKRKTHSPTTGRAKLTPDLRESVLALIAGGASYEEARAWLKKTHKVDVTKQAISKLVSRHRVERSEVSKAIARDHIARQLPKDLVAADDKHATAGRLLDIAAKAVEAKPSLNNFANYSKASAVWMKFEELKRKTLGLDQPDDTFLDNVVDLAGLALAEEDEAARAAIDADPDDDTDLAQRSPARGR